jgi:beta-glucosidase
MKPHNTSPSTSSNSNATGAPSAASPAPRSATAVTEAAAESLAAVTAGENGWRTVGSEALGAPALDLVDGPLGIVSRALDERDSSLLMASGTALAATWDPQVVQQVGKVLGIDARRHGVDVVLGPNLGLPRNPFSGRAFEMYGEDPLLSAVLGLCFIDGVQSQGVATMPKHLVGNDTETQRQTMSADIPDDVLRETYLLPFEYALKLGGSKVVMAAYNRLNGISCVENSDLLDILRLDWKWDGLVCSDWYGIKDGLASARAGADLEMPGPARFFGEALGDAVATGELSRERLEEMAKRYVELTRFIESLRAELPPITDGATVPSSELTTLRRAAGDAAVLVQNRGALPLIADPARTEGKQHHVAVFGPLARNLTLQGGTFAKVYPSVPVPNLVDELSAEERFTVDYRQGVPFTAPEPLHTLLVPETTIDVAYLPTGGAKQHEQRSNSSFVWFHRIPGFGLTRDEGRIEVRMRIRAQTTGMHTLGISGSARLSLSVDGEELTSRAAPAPEDIMGQVARAEESRAQVHLDAGQEADVCGILELVPSHVQAVGLTVLQPQPSPDALLAQAREAAAAAQTAIVVVGDDANLSRESADLDSTELNRRQLDLIEAVSEVNPRTVVVLNTGRATNASFANRVDSVIYSWYGGVQMAGGLADVLIGRRDPGGRLPVTVSRQDSEQPGYGLRPVDGHLDYRLSEPLGHRWFQEHGIRPHWPLGHGLSYTTFEAEFVRADIDSAEIRVTNTGDRAGKYVAELWLRRAEESHDRLASFAAVILEPGESRTVGLNIPARVLSRWEDGAFRIHQGERCEISLGAEPVDTLVSDLPHATDDRPTAGRPVAQLTVPADLVLNTAADPRLCFSEARA